MSTFATAQWLVIDRNDLSPSSLLELHRDLTEAGSPFARVIEDWLLADHGVRVDQPTTIDGVAIVVAIGEPTLGDPATNPFIQP